MEDTFFGMMLETKIVQRSGKSVTYIMHFSSKLLKNIELTKE